MEPAYWALLVIGLGFAIAAVVLFGVKRKWNAAIFGCALVSIIFVGILILWEIINWMVHAADNTGGGPSKMIRHAVEARQCVKNKNNNNNNNDIK